MIKRGIGHVEVILAFVLFMGFLLFGLYFFNPLNSNRVLDSSLFYAMDEISDNAAVPLIVYGVSLNQSGTSLPQNISFYLSRDALPGTGFSIETIDKLPLEGEYAAGIISVVRNGSEFFYVRFGDFNVTPHSVTGAHMLSSGINYTVASSERQEVMSEAYLRLMNQTYYENYEGLRTHFNLPRRIDFAVTVTFDNNDRLVMTRLIPEGFDVASKVERKEILRTDGRLQFADIQVQVW